MLHFDWAMGKGDRRGAVLQRIDKALAGTA